jgi:hypothetical protein
MVRHDQDVPSNTSMEVIRFDGEDSFDPVTAQLTVQGIDHHNAGRRPQTRSRRADTSGRIQRRAAVGDVCLRHGRLWMTFLATSPAWIGGARAVLAVPDFAGVSGWKRSYMPPAGHPGGWILSAHGNNATAANGACAENARFVFAQMGARR